ncbi:cytochrome c-type biogenesis protein CcmH [Cribrihabitans marinus]|uniref:Cytochrome c-type biogenesis protein CcmH n=1 Tax=Cribrihabitans marinus TaxID=1227549 RepID=A0A1H6V0M6_9RHOB|nr:c-type cytochrome biogenesis protein CcmI [Cribrihabitans marinus]GGH26639.1 c-type cytochrome biogenesis protein CcmI [Cribrihabitans marinus]SEI97436.1 cytochrome c-type biogenesis protein CcmH [Cribrihabitans marinus]
MVFWIVISGMALAVAAVLATALLRARGTAEPAAAYDLQVYREQLAAVDKDLARGVIAEADAERTRTEISRRILAADAQMQAGRCGGAQSRALSLGVALGLAAVLLGGGVWLYRDLGAPGYGDLPLSLRMEMAEERRADRPDQATAEARVPDAVPVEPEAQYAELIKRLRAAVAERPDDLRGQELLARHEANLGNFAAARAAKARVIEIKGDAATGHDYAELAEMKIAAAGGYVSPEAEADLRRALERDSRHEAALFYWARMHEQTGRPDLAFRIMDGLLRDVPPDSPLAQIIGRQIDELAMLAGVEYDRPPPGAPMTAGPAEGGPDAPGPSSADIAAASEMNNEERAEMIRGMVERLSDRLATEGGTPEEWARLIGALGVLGERDRAQAIYDESRTRFAAAPQALELLGDAARQAGITP